MRSLSPAFLSGLAFTPHDLALIEALGTARGRQTLFTQRSPEALQTLLKAALIESSESSNRIEGVEAPRGRIEALVLKSSAPTNRSEEEIAGYRDALALIHESHEHMPLSVGVIRQLHSMLGRYTGEVGGAWKPTDNEIVERNPDGSVARVRFRAVSAVATPQAMDDLVALYADAAGPQAFAPLLLVPLAILDFLCIHPFRDGNGRVSRLLTLLLLYRHDVVVGRYVSLERIVEESKETYYEVLAKSSKGWHEGRHDVFPWLHYFWGVLLRAYKEFEERVGTVTTGRGSKSEQVRLAVGRRVAPFAISDIEADCPEVSHKLVANVLRQLKDEGAITLTGKGRGAKWLRTL